MKQKMDFVTNSSSTSWLIISGALPAVTASLGWVAASVQTATASNTTTQSQTQKPDTDHGDIKDGTDAETWLMNYPPSNDPNAVHFMNANGQLTDLFWEWYDQPISSENTSALMGIAGEFDPYNRDEPVDINHLAIIIRDTPNIQSAPNPTPNQAPDQPDKPDTQAVDTEQTQEHDQLQADEQDTNTADDSQDQSTENDQSANDGIAVTQGNKPQDTDTDKPKPQDEQKPDAESKPDNQTDGKPDPVKWQNGINNAITRNEERIDAAIKNPPKDPNNPTPEEIQAHQDAEDQSQHLQQFNQIQQTIHLQLTDTGQDLTFRVDGGKVTISEGTPNNSRVKISMSQDTLDKLFELNNQLKNKSFGEKLTELNKLRNDISFQYKGDAAQSVKQDLYTTLDALGVEHDFLTNQAINLFADLPLM